MRIQISFAEPFEPQFLNDDLGKDWRKPIFTGIWLESCLLHLHSQFLEAINLETHNIILKGDWEVSVLHSNDENKSYLMFRKVRRIWFMNFGYSKEFWTWLEDIDSVSDVTSKKFLYRQEKGLETPATKNPVN